MAWTCSRTPWTRTRTNRARAARSAVARRSAAEQLGAEVAEAAAQEEIDGELLAWILAEVCAICVTNTAWDARLAAAATLETALGPTLEDDAAREEVFRHVAQRATPLTFERVDLDHIFAHAQPLLSRATKRSKRGAQDHGKDDENGDGEDLHRERTAVLRNLRLTAFDPRLDGESAEEDAIVSEADLARTPASSAHSRPQRPGVESLLATAAAQKPPRDGATGARKRSAREIAQARLSSAAQDGQAEAAHLEDDLDHLIRPDFFQGASLAAQLSSVWLVLAQNLLSDRWESRHGSAAALSAFIARRRDWPPQPLEGLAVRCLCVLGMDRFGDYAADSVVAPVRESCARLLALAASAPASRSSDQPPHAQQIVDMLCRMFSQTRLGDGGASVADSQDQDIGAATLWGRRYAALLATKFLLLDAPALARDTQPSATLSGIGDILFKESEANTDTALGKLVDTTVYNDEIRRAAADVALVCIWKPPRAHSNAMDLVLDANLDLDVSLASDVLTRMRGSPQEACLALWALLGKLDDVALMTCHSVALLAATALLACPDGAAQAPAPHIVDMMLSHRNAQVQYTGLRALLLVAQHEPRGGRLLVSAFGRDQVFAWCQAVVRVALQGEPRGENVPPTSQTALEVWSALLSTYFGCLEPQELRALVSACLEAQESSSPNAPVALRKLLLVYSEMESDSSGHSTVAEELASRVPELANQDAFLTVLRVVATTQALRCEPLQQACDEALSRDWGQFAATEVRAARVALNAAMSFFWSCFRDAGLDEVVIQAQIAATDAADANNAAALQCARAFLTDTVQGWLAKLPEPSSREDARRWNEATTAAQDRALKAAGRLADALAEVKLRSQALFQVGQVRALGAAPLDGEVGPYLRPLVPAVLSETDGLEHDALAEGLVTLMAKLGDADKHKALRTTSKKLLAADWPRPRSVFSALVGRFPDVNRLNTLLPELDSRLGESSPTALWACVIFAEQIATPGVLVHLRAAFTKFTAEANPSDHEESALLAPLTALVCALEKWDELAAATWEIVHEVLLAVAQDSSQIPEVRARSLALLLTLLDESNDPSLRFLAFSAGLVPAIMPLLHDAHAPEVRGLAAQCFALVVQVGPIERSVRVPESATFPREVQAAKARRHDGRQFLDTLLAGATLQGDTMGVLQTAQTAGIELRSYQKEGVCWLAFLAQHGLCGALCDDLGLGKTLMALTLMASLPGYVAPECSLVVCPSSLTGHWCQEAEQWYGATLVPFAYVGTPRERGMELVRLLHFVANPENASKHAVLVASYTVLARDADNIVRTGLSWRTMVLDEAHTIRNPYTVAAEKCKLVGAAAQHRLAMTGTPVHNDVLDLWSVFDFLMPGYLGDVAAFEQSVAKPVRASRATFSKDAMALGTAPGSDGDLARPERLSTRGGKREQQREAESVRAAEALEGLRRKVLPFLLRRVKDEVLQDLPPKIVQDLTVDMSPVQTKVYATLNSDKAAVEKDPLGHTMRMLMACTHPLLCLRSMKSRTRDRLERRLLESKLSTAQEDGYRASGKFRALVDLLRNTVVASSSDAGGGAGNDARLATVVKEDPQDQATAAAAGSAGAPQQKDGADGAKAIIFAQWTGTLDLIEEQVLQQALRGSLVSLRLDGSVPAHARQSIANRFNTDPGVHVLLTTTKVGGQGLNLTGANVVIFVEHDWNPMNDLQAMDRAHRLGQRRVLNVYRLLSRDTVEDRVLTLQRFKRAVADRVVDSQNSAVDSMRTDEILEALNLPEDAAARLDEVHALDPHESEYTAFDVASFVRRLDGGV